MVGRTAERALLADSVRAALQRRRQLVLIAGEPGAGKTRLAEDVIDHAYALGLSCSYGRALEDEGVPPYWPVRQVLRSLGVSVAELEHTGGRQRFQLFEAISDALYAAAEPSGLLVVLDDLQWADAATLQLLVHLATATTPARLMVVATYRDTDSRVTAADGREPLRPVLAAFAREATVVRIRLG